MSHKHIMFIWYQIYDKYVFIIYAYSKYPNKQILNSICLSYIQIKIAIEYYYLKALNHFGENI